MRISTKGRYGLVIMIYLAKEYESGRFVSLKEISENEEISLKYLEKIMLNFKDTDFFVSSRGAEGGYKLAYSPDKYKLQDIFEKHEGTVEIVSCLNEHHLKMFTDMICNGVDVAAFLIQEGSVLMDSEKERSAV